MCNKNVRMKINIPYLSEWRIKYFKNLVLPLEPVHLSIWYWYLLSVYDHLSQV